MTTSSNTNAKQASKNLNVTQSDRPVNPYKHHADSDPNEKSPSPNETSPNPKPSVTQTTPTPKVPDTPKHSAQRCPPFTPPYSDTEMTPYSPKSPQVTIHQPSPANLPFVIDPSPLKPTGIPPRPPPNHGNPPRPPANHPIKTPPRSQNPYFVYPNSCSTSSRSNSTPGHTPQVSDIKRKLDFTTPSPRTKVMRIVKRKKLLSHKTTQSQNKLWYQLLPDGVICAYAAKGSPNGQPGYLQPALRSIEDSLKKKMDSDLTRSIDVTSILPLKCPHTNVSKKIDYAKGTKQMDFCCICFIRDDVNQNTVTNGDVWCTNLVNVFNSKFPIMELAFGGNTANFGLEMPSRLDLFLLEEDVANLAMMSYEESIRDYSFFENLDIVNLYFEDSARAFTIFSGMFRI